MRKAILVLGIFLMVITYSYAQSITEVHLKSGKVVKGVFIERTDQYIVVDFDGVNLTLWLDEIEEIDGEKIFVEKKTEQEFNFEEGLNRTSAIEVEPQELSGRQEAVPNSQELFQESEGYLNVPSAQVPQADRETIKHASNDGAMDSAEKLKIQNAAGTVVGGIFVFMLLIWAVFYVYFAFCLQRMAQKIGTENPWLAWIPIANTYLMCKMALKPGWWIILFFIPFVNIIIMVLVWLEIIKALNKPGWFVVLMFVPLVNLILLGYLAFSKGTETLIPKTEKSS